MKRLLMTVFVILAGAGGAGAQDAVTVAVANPRIWDLAGEIGWLSRNKSDIAPAWNEWTDGVAGGVDVGRSWTPHLKTELRLAVSDQARVYEEVPIFTPGQPFPVFRVREHLFRTTTVGGGVAYQFFENAYFHPQLGLGVDVVRETRRDNLGGRGVSVLVQPYAGAGFKWYVNERAFVRSDVRISFGSGSVAQAAWTAGIGVDL